MHYISVFKDYLFYDDISEFLNRFYNKNEIKKKIYNITKYYQNSSKLYPNYSPLNEAKYIYKNIERKQRIIDLIEGNKNNMKSKKKENNIIFNSTIYLVQIYLEIMKKILILLFQLLILQTL